MKKGQGWMLLAFFLLFIVGIDHILWGVAALSKEELFDKIPEFGSLTFWGVFGLVFGSIVIIASFAILTKSQWARWFGIIVAFISAVGMFAVIWSHPLASFIVILLDILVIYGLTQYGGREDIEGVRPEG